MYLKKDKKKDKYLHTTFTNFTYMDEYLNQFCYLPPFNTNTIMAPTTPHHQMVRFAVLAHMAKSFGDNERYSFPLRAYSFSKKKQMNLI